jgi:hypothetical protein
MSGHTITAVFGMEPQRDQENAQAHVVGSKSYVVGPNVPRPFTVGRIERRMENFGDHGLLWFDVFDTDGRLATSMQARAVAEIHYGQEKDQ